MSHYFRQKFRQKIFISGFTLAEVVVSLGIMVLVLSIVLANQSTYTATAALNNNADTIYLSMREAQTYGVGVREFSPGSTEFNISYGLAFNISSSGSNNAYIFFADRGALNSRYDSGWACPTGGASECISKTLLTHGTTISQICYIRYNGNTMCNIGGADIVFARPETEARIMVFNQAGNYMDPQPDNLAGVRIDLVSPGGRTRTVSVYKTGQISVQ